MKDGRKEKKEVAMLCERQLHGGKLRFAKATMRTVKLCAGKLRMESKRINLEKKDMETMKKKINRKHVTVATNIHVEALRRKVALWRRCAQRSRTIVRGFFCKKYDCFLF